MQGKRIVGWDHAPSGLMLQGGGVEVFGSNDQWTALSFVVLCRPGSRTTRVVVLGWEESAGLDDSRNELLLLKQELSMFQEQMDMQNGSNGGCV